MTDDEYDKSVLVKVRGMSQGRSIGGLLYFLIWVSGMVLAKGFWAMFFAIFSFGFYSAYLVLEKVFLKFAPWMLT